MPRYSYVCMHCGEEKEEQLKFEDRHDPINQPCWNCGTSGHIQQRFKMNIAVDTHAKPKLDGGMKDVLRGIKKANPGSNIEVD